MSLPSHAVDSTVITMTTPTGPMYNSPHFKERVAASELKLKLSVSEIVKDLEDNHLRDFEKERFTCQLRCYEIMKKANAKNLTECVRNCNIDYDRGETVANQVWSATSVLLLLCVPEYFSITAYKSNYLRRVVCLFSCT